MKIKENQKVTLTLSQLKRLIKESKRNLISEGNIGEDFDFNAAYEFLLRHHFDQKFFEAFEKIQDAISKNADLHSAIETSCPDKNVRDNVIKYLKIAFPSALAYEYSINDDEYSIEGNYALSYLLQFPSLFS